MRPPALLARLSVLMAVPALTAPSLIAPTAASVSVAADSGTCPSAAAGYAGGTGSLADPLLISSPEHLQRLRDTPGDWTKSTLLTANIDMGGCVWGTSIAQSGGGWSGVFDGDGHVISGLDISTTDSRAGFIATLGSGSIVDLGFSGDVTITINSTGNAMAYAGALVGMAFFNSGPITGSFATGNVTINIAVGPDSSTGNAHATIGLGGLVATTGGTITDSYMSGAITLNATATASGGGDARVNTETGGILGYSNAATVIRSYATGPLTTNATLSGGVSQSLSDARGGLVGWNNSGSYSASVWDVTKSGLANGTANSPVPAGISGLTTSEMTIPTSFDSSGQNWSITDGFSSSTTWSMCAQYNNGYPFLSAFHSTTPCISPAPPPPVPAIPATAPLDATAISGDRSASLTWQAPASMGSFPVTHYQAVGSPSGSCLVAAPELSCEIATLRNGEEYSFRVRALTGAGWSSWSNPVSVTPAAPAPSMLITGSRDGVEVVVEGVMTGTTRDQLTPWVRFPRPHSYEPQSAVRTVSTSGQFTWQRATRKKIYVYFRAGDARSNRVIIPAR